MEDTLGTEDDASSEEEEEETQDFLSSLLGRDKTRRSAPALAADESVMELEDDDSRGPGTSTQQMDRVSPRSMDNYRNSKLQADLDKIKSVVEHLQGQASMADLLKQNTANFHELVQSAKRERGQEEKKKEILNTLNVTTKPLRHVNLEEL